MSLNKLRMQAIDEIAARIQKHALGASFGDTEEAARVQFDLKLEYAHEFARRRKNLRKRIRHLLQYSKKNARAIVAGYFTSAGASEKTAMQLAKLIVK